MTAPPLSPAERAHLSGDHGLCPACPSVVRNLSATAHNAHGALVAASLGQGDWSRAWRKVVELGHALDAFRPISEAHFDDHGRTCPTCTNADSNGAE